MIFFAGLFAVISRHKIMSGLVGMSLTYSLEVSLYTITFFTQTFDAYLPKCSWFEQGLRCLLSSHISNQGVIIEIVHCGTCTLGLKNRDI